MRWGFIGIDCGTQSTKALVVDAESGAVIARGRSPHDLIARTDGTREQEPAWWTAATIRAVREAVAGAGSVEIAGIGVSGQQHGLVALDAADRPVRPAKLWNDTTTAAQCDALTAALGGQQRVLERLGNLFLPGYTAPKVAWLRDNEPAVYRASVRFCLPHDYLNLWLTGEFATEPGDASGTAYLDVRERRYAGEVLDALDSARDWSTALPSVVPSLSVVGRLRSEAAEALGLPAGIPVSAGGGDNMCAAIGSGAVVEGRVVMSLGTSGTVFARSDAPAIDPLGEAAAFCDSAGGWLPLACTLNCTNATDWVRGLLGLDHGGFEQALAEAAPGADGLTFLPYLDGERTPNLPGADARFVGLRVDHGPAEMVRAVTEGVTFGMAYALDALRRTGVAPTDIVLVGGGAASVAWGQMCADILELPVRRAVEVDAAALGAAMQARAVIGGAGLAIDIETDRNWQPNPTPELRAAAIRAAALRESAIGDFTGLRQPAEPVHA